MTEKEYTLCFSSSCGYASASKCRTSPLSLCELFGIEVCAVFGIIVVPSRTRHGRIGIGKLIEAKENASNPFTEIEKLMSWDAFKASVQEQRNSRVRVSSTIWLWSPKSIRSCDVTPRSSSNAFEFRLTPASQELLKSSRLAPIHAWLEYFSVSKNKIT